MAGKKYRRYKHIPFSRAVNEYTYKRIARAPDPVRLAAEMDLIDEKKIMDIIKHLLAITFVWNYYILFAVVEVLNLRT